jgi:hypothetical protein
VLPITISVILQFFTCHRYCFLGKMIEREKIARKAKGGVTTARNRSGRNAKKVMLSPIAH